LESGRKATLTLTDFLVLADVLDVPPISLLFPLGSCASVEVLPGREVPTWDAFTWFTGETSVAGSTAAGAAREILDTFRHHSDLVAGAKFTRTLAKERRRVARATTDAALRKNLLARAEGYEEHALEDVQDLHDFRLRMRERGLVLPPLPEELGNADTPSPAGSAARDEE
jgi:hypothetical protein